MFRCRKSGSPVNSNPSARILVVDDREDIAELAAATLQSLGYRTDLAFSPGEALQKLRRLDYDLLFTDVVMPPGMTGYALARLALSLQPTIRVLIASGYGDIEADARLSAASAWPVIAKPYSKDHLAIMVREALDGPGTDEGVRIAA